MKIKFYIIILFFALIVNSCAALRNGGKSNENDIISYTTGWYEDNGLSPKYITYSREEVLLLLPEKKRKSPRLDFFIDTLDVLDNSERRLLQRFLYEDLSCQEYASKMFNQVKAEYLKKKNEAALYPDRPYDWSYTEAFDGRIYYPVFVVSRSRYIFSGGAHGQNEKIFFVLDRNLLSKVELDDILVNGAKASLQKYIDDVLRERYHAAPDTPLTTIGFLNDTAGVPDNFFITRGGLGFCWNPYEIAPYVMGTIDVILPYSQIENLINDRGKDLFRDL
ncbi:MAG: DUF3298 domain-containing protein [Spirochaetaceae bacterium]|jgi:hypothetical protein|nr:DUF3298 domain-containing protein [Spirochaetaceae bacterium]